MRRRSHALLLSLVVVATLAIAASASPTDQPVCAHCLDPDVRDATGEVHMDIRFHDDGSAAWTIAMEITNETARDRWREDPPELPGRDVDPHPTSQPYDEQSVSVVDGDLVVEFVDREAARPMPGGTILSEYFHSMGSGYWYVLNVDSLTVHAPEGYVVANDPPGATVDGDRATWTADDGWTTMENAFLVFAPDDAVAPGLRATIATGLAIGPLVADNLPFVLLPAIVFGVLLGVVAAGARWLATRNEVGDTTLAVAIGIALVAVVALLRVGSMMGFGRLGALWLVAVALPLLGIALLRLDRRRSALATVAVVGVFAVALGFEAGLTDRIHGLAIIAFTALAIGFAVAGAPLVLAGALGERWRRTRIGGD